MLGLLKVDFHCCVIFTCVNKIEAMYGRDIQKSAKSPNFEWSCTYTGGEKRVSFWERKKENTPKFPGIEIWY